MKWFLSRFGSAVTALSKNIVLSSIDIYETVAKDLRPTPEKSHYTFNLRDISRVFQGICACDKEGSLPGPEDLMKCWWHEIERVFCDRLVNKTDQDWFQNLLGTTLETWFKKKPGAVIKVSPMIWGNFMNRSQSTRRSRITKLVWRR
jgi:dynein heavy chain